MGWLMATIYDRMMHETEQACLTAWRADLLAHARGEVLEVGAGTGVNLDHYPDQVERVRLAEPDPHMRRLLEERARDIDGLRIEVADHAMEDLPYADASFDAVVSTLVLCSVADPTRALAETFRVLRPGGQLLFIEHVAAESGTSRHTWQHRIEPVWKRLAGNCHLTRTTGRMIERAGFELEAIQRQSMRKAFPWVRPSIRGRATKSAGV